MVKRDEGVRMGAEKLLTHSGKKMLFDAIKEYVAASIDIRTLPVRPSLNQEQVEKRVSEAEELLKDMIMQLRIQVE